jgi:hypothetical protein
MKGWGMRHAPFAIFDGIVKGVDTLLLEHPQRFARALGDG